MVSKVFGAFLKKNLHQVETDFNESFAQYLKSTRIGNYLDDIYTTPTQSELLLGKFFIMRTLLIMSLAYYYTSPATLTVLLVFSIIFDSLTGFYQHTLMNFFHKSVFQNKILVTLQNLFKRILIDIFRAEIIVFIVSGFELFALEEQTHIFINRFTSASYYLNAVLIDKLVAMGAIGRCVRSKFVIFASTVGGILCILHLAKTSFPAWLPIQLTSTLSNFFPGPLEMLIYFNAAIFVFLFTYYHYSKLQRKAGI